jgi:hypothetical protein
MKWHERVILLFAPHFPLTKPRAPIACSATCASHTPRQNFSSIIRSSGPIRNATSARPQQGTPRVPPQPARQLIRSDHSQSLNCAAESTSSPLRSPATAGYVPYCRRSKTSPRPPGGSLPPIRHLEAKRRSRRAGTHSRLKNPPPSPERRASLIVSHRAAEVRLAGRTVCRLLQLGPKELPLIAANCHYCPVIS